MSIGRALFEDLADGAEHAGPVDAGAQLVEPAPVKTANSLTVTGEVQRQHGRDGIVPGQLPEIKGGLQGLQLLLKIEDIVFFGLDDGGQ